MKERKKIAYCDKCRCCFVSGEKEPHQATVRIQYRGLLENVWKGTQFFGLYRRCMKWNSIPLPIL